MFEKITFGINQGQKIALISKNGVGKSTLLNIMCGRDIPDDGKVVKRSDIKLAYLPQNPELEDGCTVMDVLFDSDNEYVSTVRDYEVCLSELNIDNNEENQKKLDELIIKMDQLNAWDFESKVKEVLGRLKIENFHQYVDELSGGQKKKLALSKVLIEDVDLLILDEPTNHLDIDMIEWLEKFLSKQNLSILLVTHDRYFLDNVCNEIIELDHSQIFKYKGNYAYYLEKKAENDEVEQIKIEKARNLYKKELDWMNRQPQARATKAKARIDAFYDIKEIASKRIDKTQAQLDVKVERIGGKILEINNIFKSYDELKILEDFSYTFKKGEKIGLVGRNGIGKSTLLDIIMKKNKPDMGKLVYGQTIVFGYYSQEGLKPLEDKRIIEIVKDVAEVIQLNNGSKISASQFLTYFGFSNDAQYNYFSKLSGGEKRRLYLILTLVTNPNFLILDEPTNDLDIQTLNTLEEFLHNYSGCLLVASHDRYFLDKITDHIFVFEGEGKIKDFYGNYSEYRIKKNLEERKERNSSGVKVKKVYKKSPQSNKPTYKQKKEFENHEIEIDHFEKEKDELIEKLNNGDGSAVELNDWSKRIAQIIDDIEVKTARWMELADLF